MPTLRRISTAGAAAALATFGWLVATAPALSAGSLVSPTAFTEPGTHEFTVPAGVSCATFDVYGAEGREGGDYQYAGGSEVGGQDTQISRGGPGGIGGRTTATLQVVAGEVVVLTVGGVGEPGNSVGIVSGPSVGGSNGGGAGGIGGTGYAGGGGAGGASDVRQGGTGLADRVVVAGGGGGGGGAGLIYDGAPGGDGGNPGTPGADGIAGNVVPFEVDAQVPTAFTQGGGGGGGTATEGGAAGDQTTDTYVITSPATAGTAGQGGAGAADFAGGGGGGGGLFGGGGGGTSGSASYGWAAAGGGGGSSAGPAGSTFATGVKADNGGDGAIVVSWTVGDTSCVPVEAGPDAIVVDPKFTG